MVGGPYAPDWGGALTGLLSSIGFSTLLSFAPATLGAGYYVDIDTRNKNVELKGMTKGGIPDWKIKDDVSPMDIVKSGKVCK